MDKEVVTIIFENFSFKKFHCSVKHQKFNRAQEAFFNIEHFQYLPHTIEVKCLYFIILRENKHTQTQ